MLFEHEQAIIIQPYNCWNDEDSEKMDYKDGSEQLKCRI